MYYNWKDIDHFTTVFYNLDTGKVVGTVNSRTGMTLSTQGLHEARLSSEYLGEYISLESAKAAVETAVFASVG